MKNIKLNKKFLFSLLFLVSQVLLSQVKEFQFTDLDNVFQEAISIENKELSERIKKFPQAAIAINTKIAATLREKDYQKSLLLAHEIDAVLPNNADIKNFKGKIYGLLKDFTSALKAYDEALNIEPNNKWFYINKATVLADNNQSDQALFIIEKLNLLFPTWSIGYNFKAALYTSLGEKQLALETYNTAIKNKPKSAQILVNRGDLYLSLNKIQNAISDYNQALEIQPDYYRAQEKLLTIK